jgi:hypothetical protein
MSRRGRREGAPRPAPPPAALALIEFTITVPVGAPAYALRRKADALYWDFTNHVFTATPAVVTAPLARGSVTVAGVATATYAWTATLATGNVLAQFPDGYYVAEAWDAGPSPPVPLATVTPCGPFYVQGGNDVFAPAGAAPTADQVAQAVAALVIETGITLVEALRYIGAAAAANLAQPADGSASTLDALGNPGTPRISSVNSTTARVVTLH